MMNSGANHLRKRFCSVVTLLVGICLFVDMLNAQDSSSSGSESQTAFEPFTFAVIADPHCSGGVNPNLEAPGTALELYLRCFTAIDELPTDQQPDFVLVAGDIHIRALQPALSQIKIPVHYIAGNHEGKGERQLLRDLFPEDFQIDGKPSDYYSFVHKGARFIGVCDVGSGGDHVGHLTSEIIIPAGQCEWLEKQLNQNEPHKIIFAHIPPEPQGLDRNMYLARNDSRYFNSLIEKKQPTAMFFGHLHLKTANYQIGKTQVFTLRSSCWNFDRTPVGFMLVTVASEGITTQEIHTGHYSHQAQ